VEGAPLWRHHGAGKVPWVMEAIGVHCRGGDHGLKPKPPVLPVLMSWAASTGRAPTLDTRRK
jgi:hypothetical protein